LTEEKTVHLLRG